MTAGASKNEFSVLTAVQTSPAATKPRASEKYHMVFPVQAYPSRTRSVAKDILPKPSGDKGKRKINIADDDPDFSLDKAVPTVVHKEVDTLRAHDKKKAKKSSKPTAQTSDEVPFMPHTQGNISMRSTKSTGAFRYEPSHAFSDTFFAVENKKNWNAMSRLSITGERILDDLCCEFVAASKILKQYGM